MQGSYFDIFLHEITPEGNRFDTFAVSAPDRSAISTLFMDAVRDNPEQGIKVIQNLTNVGNTMGRRMLEKKYGNDVGAVQKVIQGAAAEAGSAQQAFSTLNNMRATYFMPDGSPLDLTSFAGDFVLGADGILYLMEKGSQFLQQGFAGVLGGQSQIVRPEDVGSVAAQVLQGMRGMVMSPEEAEAAKRGTAEENEAARQSNMELFQSIAADLVSDGFETVRINNVDRRVPKKLLAARRFYKYLAAYQMAAAIQGGTGGRTISDQDVENMLNSFNFTAKTTPEAELATLDAAMGMMDRIRKVKGAIGGSSTAARYAALKYEELETYADGETVVNAYDDILGASMLLKEEGAGNRRSVAPAGSSAADGVTVREFNAWLSSVGVVGLPDNATAEDIKNHPRYSEYTGGSSTT